ncbi:hypothetical protein GECvBN6_gp187c [Salmonella phage GEC_vB_N6]|nr:hypothetical protein GECvBGOT_gp172c [Salmonella phage GEC_vB_GOT]QPI15390.1 hypothetical protein GECvBN6_gp187c [Salmonella phage GEC_vB_N6]
MHFLSLVKLIKCPHYYIGNMFIEYNPKKGQ